MPYSDDNEYIEFPYMGNEERKVIDETGRYADSTAEDDDLEEE